VWTPAIEPAVEFLMISLLLSLFLMTSGEGQFLMITLHHSDLHLPFFVQNPLVNSCFHSW